MSARMDRRRFAHVGAALVASLAVTGGCGAVLDAPAAPAPPPTPQETLLTSVPGGDSDPFSFTVTGDGVVLDGVMSPAKRSFRVGYTVKDAKLGFTTAVGYTVVDTRSWVKVTFTDTEGITGLPKLPKGWMPLDPARVTDTSVPVKYDNAPDIANAAVVFRSIVEVREDAAGHYSGTTDLTKQPEAAFVEEAHLKALGAKATTVPFEAVIGAGGHLTSVVLRIPAAGRTKAVRYTVTYDDYGTASTPVEPSGAEKRTPAAAYEFING
jgi:hypothetical protein